MPENASKEHSIKKWLIPLIIAITVFALFYPTLKGKFVNWDDLDNTVNNLSYRAGWGSVIYWSFTSFFREHFMPLSWILFSAIYKIWGLNPFGYHLLSLIFHIATSIALYFLALKLLKSEFGALFSVMFFALHALRVEAVSWISAWAYPICGLFVVLSVLFYFKYAQNNLDKKKWYAAALAFFILALLAKPIVLSLPVILLILDWYPLRRKAYVEKIPFFVLSLSISLITIYSTSSAALTETRFIQRPFVALYNLSFYLEKTLLPVRLSPIYELRTTLLHLWSMGFILRYGAVASLCIAAYVFRKKYPSFTSAFLIYAVSIFPVSGILQVGQNIVGGDRYSYMATMGFAVLAGAVFKRFWNSKWKIIAAVTGIVILMLLSARTHGQIKIWNNSEALWNHALSMHPDSEAAETSLGMVFYRSGRPNEAIMHFKKALAINPKYKLGNFDLANAYAMLEQYPDAVTYYRSTLEIDPALEPAYINLGVVLLKSGDVRGAVYLYENALAKFPGFKTVRENLRNINRTYQKSAAPAGTGDE